MRAKIWMFFLILAAAFVAGSLALECPPTPYTEPPAEADPNLINFKLLCIKRAVEGHMVTTMLSACDPDGERMNYRLLQAPQDMELRYATEPTDQEAELFWVAALGIHYVDVEVYDFPPEPNDTKSDFGTIVYIIRKVNQPPVFGGCR